MICGVTREVGLAGFCLYGCFRKPQGVVYRRGPTAVSNDFARVPAEVRERGGLPTVLGRLPLARWLCVPSLWKAAGVRVGKAQTLGMRRDTALIRSHQVGRPEPN